MSFKQNKFTFLESFFNVVTEKPYLLFYLANNYSRYTTTTIPKHLLSQQCGVDPGLYEPTQINVGNRCDQRLYFIPHTILIFN